MLDPRTQHPTDSFHPYDGTRHRPHTSWEPTNSPMWPSKPPLQELNQDDSGICSPPMWTTSPPHGKSDHRSLSPTSRTQAIVRGQRELMEMVKNMPESNYELSLKDLVEHHRLETAVEERRNLTVYKRDKSGGGGGGGVGVGKRVDNKMTQVKRNRNIDRGGFYLKMGLPFSLGSKDKNKSNKKKSESSGNSSSRVTPKPDGSTKGGVDKEWWKKSPSAYKGSDSGESSINSGSSKSSGSSSSNSNSSNSRSNSRREKGGRLCWFFISRRKSQTQK